MSGRIVQAMNSIRMEKAKWIIFLSTVFVLVFFIGYPLGNLIRTSLYNLQTHSYTLNCYIQTFTDEEFLKVFTNTFKLAFMVVFFSFLFAIPMAWGVARTDMPLKKTVRSLVVLTFAIPSFLGTIGWITLLGPRAGKLNLMLMHLFNLEKSPFNIFSFEGVVFCASLYAYPVLFFVVTSALENMDASFEDAAQILGASRFRVLMSTTLPIVAPAIISGCILIFLEALVIFGVVIFLGTSIGFDTVSTKVFRLFFEIVPNFERAAALSVPLFLVTCAILIFQKKFIGKKQYTVIMGKAAQPQLIKMGPLKYLLCGYCFLFISLSVFLPSLALLSFSLSKVVGYPLSLENFTLTNFASIFSDQTSFRAFKNSFILALSATMICLALSVVISWIVQRSTIPGRGSLSFMTMLSMSFPGVVLGVALVLAFTNYPLRLYGTLWLFLLGYFIKGLPMAFMYTQAALTQLGEDLELASRILGASWLRSIRDVTAPLMSGSLLSAGIIIFILKFRDMPLSMFLYSSGNEVVAVLIYQYQEKGEYTMMAAGAIIILILSLLLVMISRKIVEKAKTSLPNQSRSNIQEY
jgi:iron(III) transport system permease protein